MVKCLLNVRYKLTLNHTKMRIIKFRAWNTKIQTMGSALPLDVWLMDIVERPDAYLRDKDNIILMQFTGLLDKNGKEIYEGDILKYKTNYYGKLKEDNQKVIEWVNDLEHDGFGEPLAMGYLFRGYDWEIIGNIWEHPQLLK